MAVETVQREHHFFCYDVFAGYFLHYYGTVERQPFLVVAGTVFRCLSAVRDTDAVATAHQGCGEMAAERGIIYGSDS
jgi:hypothetical protein